MEWTDEDITIDEHEVNNVLQIEDSISKMTPIELSQFLKTQDKKILHYESRENYILVQLEEYENLMLKYIIFSFGDNFYYSLDINHPLRPENVEPVIHQYLYNKYPEYIIPFYNSFYELCDDLEDEKLNVYTRIIFMKFPYYGSFKDLLTDGINGSEIVEIIIQVLAILYEITSEIDFVHGNLSLESIYIDKCSEQIVFPKSKIKVNSKYKAMLSGFDYSQIFNHEINIFNKKSELHDYNKEQTIDELKNFDHIELIYELLQDQKMVIPLKQLFKKIVDLSLIDKINNSLFSSFRL